MTRLLWCCIVVVPLCFTFANVAADPVVKSVSPVLDFGDAPFWNPQRSSVFFVDLHANTVHKYNTALKQYSSAVTEATDHLVFIMPLNQGSEGIAVGLNEDVGLYIWSPSAKNTKFAQAQGPVKIVKNNVDLITAGKTDSKGRLWVAHGTLEIGYLSTIEAEANVTKRLSNIVVKAMAWSTDDKVFYYVDPRKPVIMAYDYNVDTAEMIGESRTVFDFVTNNMTSKPIGIAVDKKDNLLLTCSDSSYIVQINPITGKVVTTVELPGVTVTSVTFGGDLLDELYVTSQKSQTNPDSGALFRVTGTGLLGFKPDVEYAYFD